MFDLSNEISVLKTRIRHLEQRKQRLMSASLTSDTQYWVSLDLERIETELREAKEELGKREGGK